MFQKPEAKHLTDVLAARQMSDNAGVAHVGTPQTKAAAVSRSSFWSGFGRAMTATWKINAMASADFMTG